MRPARAKALSPRQHLGQLPNAGTPNIHPETIGEDGRGLNCINAEIIGVFSAFALAGRMAVPFITQIKIDTEKRKIKAMKKRADRRPEDGLL